MWHSAIASKWHSNTIHDLSCNAVGLVLVGCMCKPVMAVIIALHGMLGWHCLQDLDMSIRRGIETGVLRRWLVKFCQKSDSARMLQMTTLRCSQWIRDYIILVFLKESCHTITQAGCKRKLIFATQTKHIVKHGEISFNLQTLFSFFCVFPMHESHSF